MNLTFWHFLGHCPSNLLRKKTWNLLRRILSFYSLEHHNWWNFCPMGPAVPSKVGKSMYSLLLAVTGGAWWYGNYLPWSEGKIWRKAFTNMDLYIWVGEPMKKYTKFTQIHGWFAWRYWVKFLAGFGWPYCHHGHPYEHFKFYVIDALIAWNLVS